MVDAKAQPPLFITGATGFIGQRVMAGLAEAADRPIRCLVRDRRALAESDMVHIVPGELARPDSYARALEGAHTVLHLAARTGKGSRADHFKVNSEGTATLVRAARDAGVVRFVNVSSIATTYQRRPAYHYAAAKAEGEQIVRSSGLAFVNVRPTLVFGRGSAVGAGLMRIAGLPVVPLFGGGAVRAQPIHVDDVAAFLVTALDDPRLDRHDVDLGGSEIVSMKELLTRIRRIATGRDATFLPVPGLATMRTLAGVESVIGGLLPISAGQLSAFVNDSTVKSAVPGAAPLHLRYTLDEMIRETVTDA